MHSAQPRLSETYTNALQQTNVVAIASAIAIALRDADDKSTQLQQLVGISQQHLQSMTDVQARQRLELAIISALSASMATDKQLATLLPLLKEANLNALTKVINTTPVVNSDKVILPPPPPKTTATTLPSPPQMATAPALFSPTDLPPPPPSLSANAAFDSTNSARQKRPKTVHFPAPTAPAAATTPAATAGVARGRGRTRGVGAAARGRQNRKSVLMAAALFSNPGNFQKQVARTHVEKFATVNVKDTASLIDEKLNKRFDKVIDKWTVELKQDLQSNAEDSAKLQACLEQLGDNMRAAAEQLFVAIDQDETLNSKQKIEKKTALIEDEHFEEYLYWMESTITSYNMGNQQFEAVLPRICEHANEVLSIAVQNNTLTPGQAEQLLDYLVDTNASKNSLSYQALYFLDYTLEVDVDQFYEMIKQNEYRYFEKTQQRLHYSGHVGEHRAAIIDLLGQAYFDDYQTRSFKEIDRLSEKVAQLCKYTQRVPGRIQESDKAYRRGY